MIVAINLLRHFFGISRLRRSWPGRVVGFVRAGSNKHLEETMATKAKRTTHRSSKGKKLYAVRDAKGRIKDIQTYKRAHGADLKRKSKAEGKSKTKRKR